MKKILLVIPIIFILAACAKNEVAVNTTKMEETTVVTFNETIQEIAKEIMEETVEKTIKEKGKSEFETEESIDYRYQKTPEEIEEEKRAQEAERKAIEAIAQTQQPQEVLGTDKNGHPYLSLEKYLTYKQQPVDENKIKEFNIKAGERLYQYINDFIHGKMTEKILDRINKHKEIIINATGKEKQEQIISYQKGLVYTWGADGKPIEAPPKGEKAVEIQNPNNGLKYTYSTLVERWVEDHTDENNFKAAAIRDGLMDSQGNTDLRKLTDEERAEIAAGIARAMGK